ncbi:MAG: hypothetical protein CMN21_15065, partial [Rubinisphaera sp.]|uniref:hypothetical protein n=1 Tax=Rubinisphaera sp. TaxID=2024857 RepID=UPI000C0DF2A6
DERCPRLVEETKSSCQATQFVSAPVINDCPIIAHGYLVVGSPGIRDRCKNLVFDGFGQKFSKI